MKGPQGVLNGKGKRFTSRGCAEWPGMELEGNSELVKTVAESFLIGCRYVREVFYLLFTIRPLHIKEHHVSRTLLVPQSC